MDENNTINITPISWSTTNEPWSCAYTFKQLEQSGWKCELFGIKNGLVLFPTKGHVPNVFWRTMQYLILGNKWSKV